MPSTPITLEEAAQRLDISAEEFKRRLKTDPLFKDLDRGKIRDGTTFRFKETAVEELGRQLGIASNPELPLAGLGDSSSLDSEDFKITPTAAPAAPKSTPKASAKAKKADDEPLLFASADDDVFSLSADETKKPKSGSDSDIRLEEGKKKKKSGRDKEEAVATEEMGLDPGPGSAVIKGGSSSKLSAPKSSGKLTADSGKGLDKPGGGDSSEFELSLDADSDDFELKLNADSSDEVALGEMPKEGGSGSGKRGGESGINLRDPADSGISLEKGKGKGKKDKPKPKPAAAPLKEKEDSDEDFELTLDSSAASALKLEGLKKGTEEDSDSEFELTLDDSSESSLEHAAAESVDAADKRDIFETDFEIPPMDESGGEAVTLDSDTEGADVELEADSDVEEDVEVDEDAPVARKKPRKAAIEEDSDVDLADSDAEDDESAAAALRGARGRRRDEDDEDEAVPAGASRPIPWGIVPPLFLFPAMILVLLGGLMGWELLQTMYGYQQPRKPAAPLVRGLASQLDMPLNDQ